MAKKKTEEKDFFEELAEACGAELLSDIGSEKRTWIDTGNLSLNYLFSGQFMGGGLALGTLAEFYGPSSSGKSLLSMNLIKGIQKLNGIGICLDSERAINRDFAKKAAKINPNQFLVLYPDTLKNCFHKIYGIITKIREKYKDKPILIVVDSLSALPSDEEFAELSIDMEKATESQIRAAGARVSEQPGSRARTCSRELRKLMGFVADNNASIIFINQIRKTFAMYGADTTSAGGGESLKFYCSTRLEIKSTTEIKEKSSGSAKGMFTKFKLTKSRFSPPRQIVENAKLMFDTGIDPLGGLLSTLLHAGRIESSGSGNYRILDPWANESGVIFKASKDKNTLPLASLLANPKLIDANSSEEIQEYVTIHGESMDDGEGDNFEKIQLPEDAE